MYWIWYPPSDWEVTGSIPDVGEFLRSPPKTPSTGSKPRKGIPERLNKPKAFDAIELK
ncbi:hypothetical protein DPMN_172772 [Dreissena polymorpha]|uniref:Uncharacterized protein n=1 Tax=Dreissena polymorpha TaxID=45954 RepID=A0A9D4IGX7_DREPO|nr:hypothetical protein DPMN_172772 [Dreissena polymorpha]